MFQRLGLTGVLGLVILFGGLGLLAAIDPLIAAGVTLVVLGLGLVAGGLLRSALGAFGFA